MGSINWIEHYQHLFKLIQCLQINIFHRNIIGNGLTWKTCSEEFFVYICLQTVSQFRGIFCLHLFMQWVNFGYGDNSFFWRMKLPQVSLEKARTLEIGNSSRIYSNPLWVRYIVDRVTIPAQSGSVVRISIFHPVHTLGWTWCSSSHTVGWNYFWRSIIFHNKKFSQWTWKFCHKVWWGSKIVPNHYSE